MAAAGYTPILLYASGTATNVPLAANLTSTATGAELALNYADGKLFYKDSGGVVQLLASKASSANSFSAGTTGLTPNTATQGAVTLGGTLATTNGGTGLTAFTANQIFYASSTSAVAQSTNLQFNGTTLTVANDAVIHTLTVGLGAGSVAGNAVVGNGAGAANTTGAIDAFGNSALGSNTSGNYNAAFGFFALTANTTGNRNAAFGRGSLASNTTGSSNAAMGVSALNANTTASNNVAVGDSALSISVTGDSNVAIGSGTLASSNGASNNTAVGYQAGYSATTCAQNVFLGYQAGYNSNFNGNAFNTCLGWSAGQAMTTGINNTYVGQSSGSGMTTGSYNTILGGYNGNQGGLDIRTASNYIVLADGAGNPRGIFDNNGSFWVGHTSAPTGNPTDPTGITLGASGYAEFSNAGTTNPVLYVFNTSAGSTGLINFGSGGANVGSITYNGALTLYNATSDVRLKENIVDAPSALSKINDIKIRSFDWKSSGRHEDFGVIAQELNTVAPECVTAGDDGEEIEKTWQVDTSPLVPALIKAIQELKAQNDALTTRIAALEAK